MFINIKNKDINTMVCLLKWAEKGIKNYKWYDISLLKATVFFSTLFLLTVWDGFRDFVLGYEWYWYLSLAILAMISPMIKMFK